MVKFFKGDHLRIMQLYVIRRQSDSDCRQASEISILDPGCLEIIFRDSPNYCYKTKFCFYAKGSNSTPVTWMKYQLMYDMCKRLSLRKTGYE